MHGGEVVKVVVCVEEPDEPVGADLRPLGLLKGTVHVMPDFDAPLEEFKDYT